MNLPECLYKNMLCVNEEEVYASEELKNEIESLDRYKYITLEIIAHVYKTNMTTKYQIHHYKICFRNIYRLNGIGFIGKIIFGYSSCVHKLANCKENIARCKSIIEHIRKYKQLEPMNYDLYKAYKSGPSIRNIPSKSKRFLKCEEGNVYSRGVDWDDIETTEFTFTCRDLHSEELDKLIYPNEYMDKKYLEF